MIETNVADLVATPLLQTIILNMRGLLYGYPNSLKTILPVSLDAHFCTIWRFPLLYPVQVANANIATNCGKGKRFSYLNLDCYKSLKIVDIIFEIWFSCIMCTPFLKKILCYLQTKELPLILCMRLHPCFVCLFTCNYKTLPNLLLHSYNDRFYYA